MFVQKTNIDLGEIKHDILGKVTEDELEAGLADSFRDRATHTGTQLASTISDFDTAVQSNSLDEMTVPANDVDFNNKKIRNLLDPTNDQDAATKNYVDMLVQGLNAKRSVLCATTTNITLSGVQTIDTIFCNIGTRVLVKDQTSPAENGIYIVQASAWYRASDMNTWSEVPSAYTFIEAGATNSDQGWTCTADFGGTLDTTAINWIKFSTQGTILAGNALTKSGNTLNVNVGASIVITSNALEVHDDYKRKKVTTSITCDGVSTAFVKTHSLNSTRVEVQVFDPAIPDDVTRISTSQIRVYFGKAPANGKVYELIILG
jgi:hypothetical protein